jgi:cytoskeleton protein RodZ
MTALPGKPAANASPANDSGVERLLASSPGARLQKGREAKQMAVSDAADALHLSAGVVKALEADDFRALPNATFVKGYIRSYARLLDIPSEELVRSYESITGCDKPKPLQPIDQPSARGKRGVLLVVLAGIVALGVLVALFWPSSEPSNTHGVATTVTEPAVAAVLAEPVDTVGAQDAVGENVISKDVTLEQAVPEVEASIDTPIDTLALQQAPLPINEQPVTLSPLQAEQAEDSAVFTTTAPLQVQSVPAPQGSEPSVTGVLSMTFSGDCWVEVFDGTGKSIYSNLKRHGETLTLSGQPPFEAKLGNGDVVSLSYNGQPVSFSVPSHKVVRVRLGQ